MKAKTIKRISKISNWCFSLCFIPLLIFSVRACKMDTDIASSTDAIAFFWPLILTFGLMILGFILWITGMIAGGILNMSILAKGLPATAKVIRITDTKTTINDDPVLRLFLRVYPENQPSFEAEAQKLIPRIELHKLRPGIFLPVKYKPQSHDVAIVNIEALKVAAPVEEEIGLTVILKDAGADKIRVVKVLREITGLGLKDAYDLVEKVPSPVKENVSEDEALSIMATFAAVGATCDLKEVGSN